MEDAPSIGTEELLGGGMYGSTNEGDESAVLAFAKSYLHYHPNTATLVPTTTTPPTDFHPLPQARTKEHGEEV